MLLAACSAERVCTAPYVLLGDSCCLDEDDDGACDAAAALDSDQLPVQGNNDEYVCENGAVVTRPEECTPEAPPPLPPLEGPMIFAISEEQDPAYIESFTVKPVCRGPHHAAQSILKLRQRADAATFQVFRDPDSQPQDIGEEEFVDESTYYIGFCEKCSSYVDAQLEPGKPYLYRVQLTYGDRMVYTRDYLIDATPAGEYMNTTCG
jgi:hypothetical protein